MVVLKMLETNTADKTTGAEFPRGQTPCFYHIDDVPFVNTDIGCGLITPVFFVPVEDAAFITPTQQVPPVVQTTSI